MTDTYSPDRHSIVTFLSNLAGSFDKGPERDLVYTLVTQIQRGDDITPAKPKATIADLLALHDLDLGALAHKVGVTGEGFTTAHLLLLLGAYTRCDDDYTTAATDAGYAMDGGWMKCARKLAATGAKVRAAMSEPTIKVSTPRVLQHDSAAEARIDAAMSERYAAEARHPIKATPRVLQSADEAPCGSLIIPDDDEYPMTIRYPDGRGWHIYATPLETTRKGWLWKEHGIEGPARLIAEGLTEAECRHLSGLSAADALVWCLMTASKERSEKARADRA